MLNPFRILEFYEQLPNAVGISKPQTVLGHVSWITSSRMIKNNGNVSRRKNSATNLFRLHVYCQLRCKFYENISGFSVSEILHFEKWPLIRFNQSLLVRIFTSAAKNLHETLDYKSSINLFRAILASPKISDGGASIFRLTEQKFAQRRADGRLLLLCYKQAEEHVSAMKTNTRSEANSGGIRPEKIRNVTSTTRVYASESETKQTAAAMLI